MAAVGKLIGLKAHWVNTGCLESPVIKGTQQLTGN